MARRRILHIIIAIFLIIIGDTNHSFAYKLLGIRWTSSEYNYYINPIGVDNGVDYSQYSSVIIDGASVWTHAPATNVGVNYMGITSSTEWGGTWPPDYQNTVTWKTGGWSGNTIGLATYWYVGEEIVDSDIKLNTAFASDSRLEKLVTHEVGHSLGIGHTREAGQSNTQDEYEAIMYYLLHGSNHFNGHDKCAISAIYPSSGCNLPFEEGYFEPQPCCSEENSITISFSNLIHTYSGTTKNASISTEPHGIAYSIIYLNQSSQAVSPVNAGTYTVIVNITEPGYESEGPFYDNLIINKKNLSATANNQTVNFGDPEPNYTITYQGFVNGETSDDLITKPIAYITPEWPAGPGIYTIHINIGESNNYNLSYNTGILTVNGISVNSVTFNNTNIVYDGNPKFATPIIDPPNVAQTIEYTLNGQTVAEPVDANNYDVLLTITEEGYNPDTFHTVLEIQKASLMVEATDTSIIFGSPEPAYDISVSGFVLNESELNLSTIPWASIEEMWPVLPGNYTIAPQGGSAQNYSFSYVSGILTVNEATIDSIQLAENSIVYNGHYFEPDITSYPEQVNFSFAFIQNENKYTRIKDAGTYQIEIIIDEPGYKIDTIYKNLTIHKAPLLIKAEDYTLIYGDNEPQYSFTYSGFAGSDNEDSLENQPSFTQQYTWPIEPGTYEIELSHSQEKNYVISSTNGILTIEKAELTFRTHDKTMTYGDTLPEFDFSITGFKFEDNVLSISQLPDIYIDANTPFHVGVYAIYASNGHDTKYRFNYELGQLLVEPAILTISADTTYIVYGENNISISYQITGFVNNDDVSIIEVLPEPVPFENWPWNAGIYALEFEGAEALNYTFQYLPASLNIQKAQLTITPDDFSISYGEPLPEFTYHISGFVYSDDESAITQLPELFIEDSEELNAGAYTILANGATAQNYSFVYNQGTLWVEPIGSIEILNSDTTLSYTGQLVEINIHTIPQVSNSLFEYSSEPLNAGEYTALITASEPGYISAEKTINISIEKALLEVTAHDTTILSHQEQPAFTFDIIGFMNGEDESALSQIPEATINTSWPPTAGTHVIEIGNASAINYNFNYNNGILTLIQTYLIEVSAQSNGTILINNNSSPTTSFSEYVIAGENSSEFTAIANEGYHFISWSNGNTLNPIILQNINDNISIYAEIESLTGTESNTYDEFVIYPNPIEANKNTQIHLSHNHINNNNLTIRISDVNGRILEEHRLNSNQITIKPMQKGIYIIHVFNNESFIHQSKLLAR